MYVCCCPAGLLVTLAAAGLLLVLTPLMLCRGLCLCLTPASGFSSTWQQEVLWPRPSMLAAAIHNFLGMSMTQADLPFYIGQADSLLLACLGQGFGGPLVLELLLMAIFLRLKYGERPSNADKHHGLSLLVLLGPSDSRQPSVLERLLEVPYMMAGSDVVIRRLKHYQQCWRDNDFSSL